MSALTKPVVAVLDAMPQASQAVINRIFGAEFDVRFVQDDLPESKQAIATDATVLLTMWGSVDATTIAATSACRLIQKLGVGTEKIDDAAASARGIVVLKATGINAEAVAELTVLLMLAVGRQFVKATAAARSGRSTKEALRAESFQLLGKTVGLYGCGHIGRAVARRLAGFDVSLLYHDADRLDADTENELQTRYVTADELVETSDVISLHLPSAPSTRHVINESVLARVKPGVTLINTARGSLIDEDALAQAIIDGRVLGAGLDVTETEPISVDSPLFGLERVILTPHIGGAVANNFDRVIARAYNNTRAILAGKEVAAADVVGVPAQASAAAAPIESSDGARGR